MRINIPRALVWALGALCFAPLAYAQQNMTYRGMCDASAGVSLSEEHFVVADDESNDLRTYRRGQPKQVGMLNLADFLGTKKEADLEGAAMTGNRIYRISSHGRSKDGEYVQQRHQLLATERKSGAIPMLSVAGRPYTALLSDLVEADKIWGLGFAASEKLAPEAPGGFNIEGLAATAAGGLMIGLRNPVPAGMGIIVSLENPKELVETNAKPKFGAPFRLDLGGRGVRSIEFIDPDYLLVAGAWNDEGDFALCRWSGKQSEKAVLLESIAPKSLHPEALLTIPGTRQIQILSDDGAAVIEGEPCKKMKEDARRSFRSTTVDSD